MGTPHWHLLSPPDAALFEAHVQLHHALQPAASIGHTFVPAISDQSHSNFEWSDELGALVGKVTADGYRAGLRFHDLTLLLLTADATIHSGFTLAGHSLADAYRWLEQAIPTVSGRAADAPFVTSPYDLPPHPNADGAAFSDSGLYAELARWYADAERALQQVAAQYAGAAPVRCWPHHFDIATLIVLDPDDDPEEARSIGVGMTPGDGGIAEPYWYVTPWPYLENPDLPPLDGGGRWNTEGWLGAMLAASATTSDSAQRQEAQVTAFLNSAIQACLALLER